MKTAVNLFRFSELPAIQITYCFWISNGKYKKTVCLGKTNCWKNIYLSQNRQGIRGKSWDGACTLPQFKRTKKDGASYRVSLHSTQFLEGLAPLAPCSLPPCLFGEQKLEHAHATHTAHATHAAHTAHTAHIRGRSSRFLLRLFNNDRFGS